MFVGIHFLFSSIFSEIFFEEVFYKINCKHVLHIPTTHFDPLLLTQFFVTILLIFFFYNLYIINLTFLNSIHIFLV